MSDIPTPSELAVRALRYAAADLPADEMTAFEERLADDQPARDALAEAIRLSASAVGQPPPVPSAGPRAGVRDRLFPTWFTRLFPRKSYRGHPATWAGLGGGLATAAAVVLVSLGGDPPTADVTPSPTDRAPLPPAIHLRPPPPPSARDGNQAVAPTAPPTAMPAPVVPGPRADRVAEPPQPMPVVEGGRTNG